jgi:hypothetical protein
MLIGKQRSTKAPPENQATYCSEEPFLYKSTVYEMTATMRPRYVKYTRQRVAAPQLLLMDATCAAAAVVIGSSVYHALLLRSSCSSCWQHAMLHEAPFCTRMFVLQEALLLTRSCSCFKMIAVTVF